MPIDENTLVLLVPEIILVVTAIGTMVGSAFSRRRACWVGVTIAAFLLAAGVLFRQDYALWQAGRLSAEQYVSISGPLFVDLFGHALRWAALLVGLLIVLVGARAAEDALCGEYFGSLTLIFVGLMLVSTAADLVLLFLAMELISIPTYVLLFLGRRNRQSVEATAKYFFLSLLSSALLLYGFSFLYGMSGTTQLEEIRAALASNRFAETGTDLRNLAPLVLILIFAGLGFKIAAVPFHFYAPDVFQGTTNTNAGLLSVVPKIVGIVALIRILAVATASAAPWGWQIVLVVSLLTMTLGNVCALWQKNLRRLLAYSSIAHAGYMLIGLAVALASHNSPNSAYDGLGAMLLYLVVYVVASLGTFAGLVYLSSTDRDMSNLSELSGLGRRRPLIAAAIAVFMFSLSGIPPMAGFWGKLTLFTSAISVGLSENPIGGEAAVNWFIVLAIVGVINAAIAAAYYLKVVGTLYFQPSGTAPIPAGGLGARLTTIFCALIIISIGLWPGRLVELTRSAALSTRPWATTSTAPPAAPRADVAMTQIEDY